MSKHSRIFAKTTLRAERLSQGWLAADFSRRIGITRSALSGIELRKYGVSERVAVEMAKTLHADVSELFEFISPYTAEEEKEEAALVA